MAARPRAARHPHLRQNTGGALDVDEIDHGGGPIGVPATCAGIQIHNARPPPAFPGAAAAAAARLPGPAACRMMARSIPERRGAALARPTVLMPNPMAPLVVEALDREVDLVKLWEHEDRGAALDRVAPGVGALAVGGHLRVDGDYMARFPRLQIVSSFGVGYDSVDAAFAGERGIVVTNTPGVLDDEVADTALGLVLCAVRQLPAAERHLRAGRWTEAAFPLSPTLRGRTMGIIGLGRIGKAIAKRAEAFGLLVRYHGRSPQPDVAYPYHSTAAELAESCDILVVVTPGGEGTRHLVDAAVLRALGPTGILVNVARGSVVDEAALIAALQDGTILGAGLDVFAEEPKVPQALLDLDHVVLLPHVGSASHHTRDAMGQLVVDNILRWRDARPPLTPVAETPWSGGYRAIPGLP